MVSPLPSRAVTLRPSLRASRRTTDRRLPFQSGSVTAPASLFVEAGGWVVISAGAPDDVLPRLATVNFGAGAGAGLAGATFFGVGVGVGFGSAASGAGTEVLDRAAAVASIRVATMSAVA